MSFLKVNNIDIPTPSSYSWSKFAITKSERNAKGDIIIEFVAEKRKLETSYNFLTKEQYSSIISLITYPNILFDLTYIDGDTGDFKTGKFYAGAPTSNAIDFQNGIIRWKDIKINYIER